MAAESSFRAMGSDCHIIVVGGPPGLLDVALHRVDDLEQRWSRFIPTSEVSRLNEHPGVPMRVSADTAELVRRALEAWHLSGGSYDPTVLGAVLRAGYDRSFEKLGEEPGPDPALGTSPLQLGAARIEITGETVRLPAGTGFDPGGIGKGLAADLVAEDVMAAGAEGVCVNLGGDVRVRGVGPADGGWTVAVEHPWSDEPIAVLGLTDGAVATSTTLRRQWVSNGEQRHHLIDPATGLPSDTDLTLATVVTGQGWVAEVLAKAVLLRGAAHPFDLLGGTGAQALVVDRAGAVTTTPGLNEFLGEAYHRTSIEQPRGHAT
ncbi:MAG TPA: FAD:protein FMN transferase [Acidimicrobiales bacterium]|nr:FAD:protein FMN transferase [Acidimicrobiales bacterium]